MGNPKKVENQVITIHCVDGLVFTGELLEYNYFAYSSLKWVKIKVNKGEIAINARFIVSITWPHPSKSEKK